MWALCSLCCSWAGDAAVPTAAQHQCWLRSSSCWGRGTVALCWFTSPSLPEVPWTRADFGCIQLLKMAGLELWLWKQGLSSDPAEIVYKGIKKTTAGALRMKSKIGLCNNRDWRDQHGLSPGKGARLRGPAAAWPSSAGAAGGLLLSLNCATVICCEMHHKTNP